MRELLSFLLPIVLGACTGSTSRLQIIHNEQQAYLLKNSDTLYSGELSELKQGKVVVLQHESEGSPRVYWVKCERLCDVKNIAWWMVLLVPLVAIVLAMVLKEVLMSLFVGCVLGLWIYHGMDAYAVVRSVLSFFEDVLPSAVGEPEHASVIVFSLLIGGVVNLLSANGDMSDFIKRISKRIRTRKQALLVGWLSGVVVFFDDYANTLILGNTLRPIMRHFRVSPAKLAYIIDSTSAPVAAIALISTWIGIELGYIEDALRGKEESAYWVFLHSLKYAFYPVFALVMVGLVALTGRDIGPMVGAELHATKTGRTELEQQEEKGKWWRVPLIIGVLVAVAFVGLVVSGWDARVWSTEDVSFLRKCMLTLGNADGFKALLWASGASLLVAFALVVPDLKLNKTSQMIIDGFKLLLPAVVVLVLAWSLSQVVMQIGTAQVLTAFIKRNIPPEVFPTIVFALSALIAFATGTSWGTMAMVYPLALPTALIIGDVGLVSQCTAAVLGGAVFGDHCSPISDTTVLSSLASNCNHLEHVRTQMPYALLCALLTFLAYIGVGAGVPWWAMYTAGVLTLLLILLKFGTTTDHNDTKDIHTHRG